MSEKVCVGLFLVGLEGSLEESLEAWGNVNCGCCPGHDNSDGGGTDEVEDECDNWEEGARQVS